MRLERLLPWVLMPNIAMAGGGGRHRPGPDHLSAHLGMGLHQALEVLVPDDLWRPGSCAAWQGGSHPIAQSMAQANKDCPYCAEPILAKARKCKHCGSDLS